MIVSKQPEAGKLKVSLETGLKLEVPDLGSYHLLNAAEKLELERSAGLYTRRWNATSPSELQFKEAYEKRLRDVLSGVNTDWLK